MFPEPDIDMIGAPDEEMELSIGHGHVLYTGGAEGTDQEAEEMAKHFDMQVDAIVPPKSSKGRIHQSCNGGSPVASQSSPLSGC